jgi:Ser/Thr protein kinase RdoA (MazF antagonist)
MTNLFLERINYKGDLTAVLIVVADQYNLGKYKDHKIIEIGYEDLNIHLRTSKGNYVVKIFGSFRDGDNIKRYVEIMEKVVSEGIAHPKLYSTGDGYLYKYDKNVSLIVMDLIDGNSFYDLNARPTLSEAKTLIKEASKINGMNIKIDDYYDEWSPVNLVKEFELKNHYLDTDDRERVGLLVKRFSKIKISDLPHSFVHGDIIRPNVLKDINENLFIIDYSCASIKPRVQELAILLCGMFFNEKDPSNFQIFYDLVLANYKPGLNSEEKEALPLFVKAGFSMYIMQGIYTKIVKGISHKENDYWILLGKIGLKHLSQ